MNRQSNPNLSPEKVSMKELILYIKLKRGLSITAYQFHKLLQYEENYQRVLKNKKLIAQTTQVQVPKGDKFEKLRSHSIKFHSQNPKLKTLNHPNKLIESGIPTININTPKPPGSYKINLKHSLQFNNQLKSSNPYTAQNPSIHMNQLNKQILTPLNTKKMDLFPSYSNNNLKVNHKLVYPKSLNGSAQKIQTIYSQAPDRYSARGIEQKNSEQLSSFNLYQRQKKNMNMLNKSNHHKINKPSKNNKRAKTTNTNNVNNINIYNTKYSKHLKRAKLKPHHKKKEFERIKKNNMSHSMPEKFANLKNKRVAPPKPFKGFMRKTKNSNVRRVKNKKNKKPKKNGGYGTDFYSKTNEELDAEYEEARLRQEQGFKQKWKEFTSGFFSMFGN